MNTNELIEILENANQKDLNQFLSQNKATLKVIENIERNQFDYSWLKKIEDTIEYLDKVVRNPRKFIAQEEEIVPIEKAKKISQESIKHLATHTNLIQDVDKDGTITPLAVLNIHKEESFDIYENRFVKSLLDNIRAFLYLRQKVTSVGSFANIERKVMYDAETKVDHETVKISFSLETKSHEDLVERSPAGLSVEERIERVSMIIGDFYKSPFLRDLANALPVKSPIRKTNVILKDQNFKKLLELWEFIERYEVTDVTEKTGEREVKDDNIENKLNMAFFLDYSILNTLQKEKKFSKKEINKYYIKKLIKDFIAENENVTEKDFKKILVNEFKEVKKERAKARREIMRIMKSSLNKYEQIKKAILKLFR